MMTLEQKLKRAERERERYQSDEAFRQRKISNALARYHKAHPRSQDNG